MALDIDEILNNLLSGASATPTSATQVPITDSASVTPPAPKGLLDRISDFADSAGGKGLAVGLLQGGDYSTTPRNFAGILGQGLATGQQFKDADIKNKVAVAGAIAKTKGKAGNSPIGKLKADMDSGLISPSEYRAGLIKATTVFDPLGNVVQASPFLNSPSASQVGTAAGGETSGVPGGGYDVSDWQTGMGMPSGAPDIQTLAPQAQQSQIIPPNISNPTEGKAYAEEMGKSKAAQNTPATINGMDAFDQVTNQLIGLNKKLAETGGSTKVGAPTLDNIQAYIANTQGANLPFGVKTPGGQDVNQVVASPEQSIRNQIESKKPLMLTAIMRATGLTSAQLNSNAEMQNYLKTMGSPTADVDSKINALNDLNSYVKTLSGRGGQQNQNSGGVPAGAQVIGTSGGKKVYQLPDGSHAMEQ